MIPVNGPSFGRRGGLPRRYPGGTENDSILRTVLRSSPNTREASRVLIPSTRHARRTRAYISTRYIPPPSSQSNPDRRLYAVPFWSATAGSTGRFSGGLLRRRSHSPRSAPPPPIGARLFESEVPPSRQTSPIANRYMIPTSSCFDEHTTSFDGSAHLASTLALLPSMRRASCALKSSSFDCASESIRANKFAQLSRKVFAGAHLARPHDQNAPSLISQRFDCSFVSPCVCGEFVFPKLSVRLWRGSVFTPRMAMPIASMYEDGFLFRTENDIGSTRQLLDVRIEIISQCRQTTLYRLFRYRVSPPHGGHPPTGFWRWIHQPFDPFV